MREKGGKIRQWNEELLAKLLKYAGEGDAIFSKERGNPKGAYFDWNFYGGCQACEAAQAVAEQKTEKG